GTPGADDPFQLYVPYRLLDSRILGFDHYADFRYHHADYVQKELPNGERVPVIKTDADGKRCWRNLEELREKIAPFTRRVLRRDLRKGTSQEKIYGVERFDLAPEQRRVYDELRKKYAVTLGDGRDVSVEYALTLILRLQQVASNFWPADVDARLCHHCDGGGCVECGETGTLFETETASSIVNPNPRLEAFTRLALRATEPMIVWARFTHDVQQAGNALELIGRRVGYYTGAQSIEKKRDVRAAFAAGRLDALVGNQRAGGRGIDLSRAGLVVYYSNSFSGVDRTQSEDRAVHLDKDSPTWYVDLIARGTVDETKILPALREKRDVGARLRGDPPTEWL
ncbi:MAG TPA: DEAD/DEAH box helicase, partial [Candidatus Cybelea sp.]